MKKYEYVITLKSGSFSVIDTISKLMLLLSFAAFVYNAIVASAVFYAVIAFLLLTWFTYVSFLDKKRYIIFYRLGFVVAAIGWFYAKDNYSWLGVLFILVALLEKQVKFPQEIGVDEEGITFNTFPKRYYYWGQIDNMILKDGLITIDYKNNKLFQKEIEKEVNPALENELNDFCREKLVYTNSNAIPNLN
jgi:energy-coupling factor transporter transmembrane protein EcfT